METNSVYQDNQIKFSGDLTINRITEIHPQLETALSKSDHLIISHDSSCIFDTTYFQLLYSLKRTAEEKNKKFEIISEQRFIASLKSAGFYDLLFNSMHNGDVNE